MIPIVQKGNPVLRKIAKDVPEKSIGSPKIAAILGRMKEVLHSQEDAVAIAAPQIGETLRIFIVSERVFELPEKIEKRREQIKDRDKHYGHLIFINPIIKKLSKERAFLEEGCLSIRYKYGKIERAKKATVSALDAHGKKFTRGASGLLAQIFQHEADHLNGILFTDKAIDLKEVPPRPKPELENKN